jgi:hypothetical protein
MARFSSLMTVAKNVENLEAAKVGGALILPLYTGGDGKKTQRPFDLRQVLASQRDRAKGAAI